MIMLIAIVAGAVCLFIGVLAALAALLLAARRGYRRLKTGINVGRSGFYIEADDGRTDGGDEERDAEAGYVGPLSFPAAGRVGSRPRAGRDTQR